MLGTLGRVAPARRSRRKHRYRIRRGALILVGAQYWTDPNWRQFRFSVGAPDAEAKYKAALQEVQKVNANAVHYPSLYVRPHYIWTMTNVDVGTL